MAARIRIGRPVKVARYRDRAGDRMVLRQITDEVMFEIRELSGQEYVNTYATKKADAMPTQVTRVPLTDGDRASAGVAMSFAS
jgi:1-acyl-sn-glycerol-3-phosphate acyltransferase